MQSNYLYMQKNSMGKYLSHSAEELDAMLVISVWYITFVLESVSIMHVLWNFTLFQAET